MTLIARAGSVGCSAANAFATLEPRCAPNAHPYHSRPQAWMLLPDADANPCICAASRTARVVNRNRVPLLIPEHGSASHASPHLPYQNICTVTPLNKADCILH
jgi:hypothetical protein